MSMKIAMTERRAEDGRVVEHVWPFPLEETALAELLTELFEQRFDQITFGPIIQGAAFELKAPGKPDLIGISGGYLTVHWGRGGHFHLCIGENTGSPPVLIAHRRPSRAELFRSLDARGAPNSWGFRMFNGHGEPQVSIFFANPFIGDDDGLTPTPDWSRLALWEHIARKYAGHEPDGLDTTSLGFGK